MSLSNKSCTPCLGNAHSLPFEITKKLLLELNNGWIIQLIAGYKISYIFLKSLIIKALGV